jgi:hypothetical protein
MRFEILGEISNIETFATGSGIRRDQSGRSACPKNAANDGHHADEYAEDSMSRATARWGDRVKVVRVNNPKFYFGGEGIADEWWSTIAQFCPSFTYVKLKRAGIDFVSPSLTKEKE